MTRKNVSSGSPWEPIVGYSRAVRVGAHIFVAGTTGTDAEGRLVAPGDLVTQTRVSLAKIGAALEEVGAKLSDVVRTRIYVTDIDHWELVARVHGETFASIRPATSLVEVRRLISPDILVEIEADAIVGG
jgi:enamine deaminase RidA (YjgF/YER057c/UK114 family)